MKNYNTSKFVVLLSLVLIIFCSLFYTLSWPEIVDFTSWLHTASIVNFQEQRHIHQHLSGGFLWLPKRKGVSWDQLLLLSNWLVKAFSFSRDCDHHFILLPALQEELLCQAPRPLLDHQLDTGGGTVSNYNWKATGSPLMEDFSSTNRFYNLYYAPCFKIFVNVQNSLRRNKLCYFRLFSMLHNSRSTKLKVGM